MFRLDAINVGSYAGETKWPALSPSIVSYWSVAMTTASVSARLDPVIRETAALNQINLIPIDELYYIDI